MEDYSASSRARRSHLSFIYVASRNPFEKTFRLISPNSNILHMIIENGELSLGIA